MSKLFEPLVLRSGIVLPNRICKAAMEEDMATYGQLPSCELIRLFHRWACGQPGLIITGNVMVCPDAMHGPGGVYLGKDTLENPEHLSLFEQWSEASKSNGSAVFVQLSHPGRQVFKTMRTDIVSASSTEIQMEGSAAQLFTEARALSHEEIIKLIGQFADSANAARQAGFDGVQIHAAHGYLVAQFLSPLSNHRTDSWGGDLRNRARFLIEIVRAVKAETAPGFGVAVKLNSADFQKGGFDERDAKQVVEWLNQEGVDFVELSGGSYESAAMMGAADLDNPSSTLLREIYFIEFAKMIESVARMPLMVTGGISKKDTAEKALDSGVVEIVGIARAMSICPDLPKEWAQGRNLEVQWPQSRSKRKAFKLLADMALTKANLYAIGDGLQPKARRNIFMAILKHQMRMYFQTKRYRKWLAAKEL